jgi:S1-C subfamily serine protease
MNDRFISIAKFLSILFLLIGIGVYLLPAIEYGIIGLTTTPRTVTARGDLAADEKNTIEIFQQASPAVVYISTSQRVMNPWTRNVFNVPQGTGSGFVWDKLGHVVTNNHVIAQASEAQIRLNDGRTYMATLVGTSPDHDLAVLRIRVPINSPPAVPIGTSGDLKVGQKVSAIGNPFGLDYTLTTGVISALDRSLSNGRNSSIDHLIQTDAAINPGNSGGPLLDSAGRLIGINTAIYSPSGAYAGIGFAVPVDTVNRVVPELIAKGRYERPKIGVDINEEINKALLSQLGVEGVLILKVYPGSAAQAAGLKGTSIDNRGEVMPGDVVMQLGDSKVTSVRELLSRLDDFSVGDKTSITIWRKGEIMKVDLQL